MSTDGNGFLSERRGCTLAFVGSSRWDSSLGDYLVFVVYCVDIQWLLWVRRHHIDHGWATWTSLFLSWWSLTSVGCLMSYGRLEGYTTLLFLSECAVTCVGCLTLYWTLVVYMAFVDFMWMFSDFCRVFDVIGFTGGVHGLCCFCVNMQWLV